MRDDIIKEFKAIIKKMSDSNLKILLSFAKGLNKHNDKE